MNILYLYSNVIDPTKGGIQRVTYVVSDYLRSQGHTVYYIGLYKSESSYQLACPDNNVQSKNNINYIKKIVRDYHIDVAIFQAGVSALYADWGYAAKEAGAKLISCIHNSLLGSVDNMEGMLYSKLVKLHCLFMLHVLSCQPIKQIIRRLYIQKKRPHYKALLNKSDKVVLLSDSFKIELAQFVDLKNNSDKVCAIPNPVSFEKPKEDLIKERRALFVGRIDDKYKRVDLLLQIWEKLGINNSGWILDIVGDGPFLNSAKEYVNQHDIKNVFFHGFCDPQPFYNRSSIFCMTSASEGFGIVLIEAMQAGVVPFAFNSYRSVVDIIDNKENGFLISPFNIDEYVEKMTLLMNNVKLLTEMSEKAKRKAAHFEIDAIGARWESLLHDLILS